MATKYNMLEKKKIKNKEFLFTSFGFSMTKVFE